MNYFIYNDMEFSYIDIGKYSLKNNLVFIELIFPLEIDVFNIWKLLKQNLNSILCLYNVNFNLNFVLTECYNDNNKLFLEGEIF